MAHGLRSTGLMPSSTFSTGVAEGFEKAFLREVTLRAEGLGPGQVESLFPYVQVGLVELPPGIPDRHTVLGGDQLLTQHVLPPLALNGCKQRGLVGKGLGIGRAD